MTAGGEEDARHREATASSMGAQQVDGSSIGEEIKNVTLMIVCANMFKNPGLSIRVSDTRLVKF